MPSTALPTLSLLLASVASESTTVHVLQLTFDTFDRHVFDGATSFFIKFYAPWCEWSVAHVLQRMRTQ